MTQPELGRKIAELRKAKGWTQEELVHRCNLNVRTLQRIESGEVTPRGHTIRVIFEALEVEMVDSRFVKLRDFSRKIIQMFNLKTNTMRKVSILTIAVLTTAVVLLSVSRESPAQSTRKAKETIEGASADFIQWFNEGNIDQLLMYYRDDACLLTVGCGKETIRSFYEGQSRLFRFEELRPTSVSVADSIAVERGEWTVRLHSGEKLRGQYLTEWRRTGKKWLIVNDLSGSY